MDLSVDATLDLLVSNVRKTFAPRIHAAIMVHALGYEVISHVTVLLAFMGLFVSHISVIPTHASEDCAKRERMALHVTVTRDSPEVFVTLMLMSATQDSHASMVPLVTTLMDHTSVCVDQGSMETSVRMIYAPQIRADMVASVKEKI